MNLEQFLAAYITAALWSTSNNPEANQGEYLDETYGPDNLAPETLASMRADCERFIADNAADLALYAEQRPGNGQWTPSDYAGHDFWLTRCGHGVGFWDRGLGDLGDRLSEAARAYGNIDLYVGDDGMIYA